MPWSSAATDLASSASKAGLVSAAGACARDGVTASNSAARLAARAAEVVRMRPPREGGRGILATRGRMRLMDSEALVREFWRLMATNDFHAVKRVLADGFVMEWPQSNERIRGADNFARMNAEYPTTGRWQFRINRLVASAHEVVTQV